MNKNRLILLTGLCLFFALHIGAEEIILSETDSLTVVSDTSVVDSVSFDPEWYVAPEVREDYIRAPKRASANACPIDSLLIFNIDSVLVEVTVYEYGDTTRTMVWTVNPDGTRTGKSKTEEASTSTASFNATYAWDNTTNDWMGTSKTEHVYSDNKETIRILYNTWLNNNWLADTKYTWNYDTEGRETEYTTYTRDESTNQLVLSKQRIREYNEAGKMSSEIQYTAHDAIDWSAGTKKEYDYDAAGNQIEYTYYSSLSNGNWIGSTHEVWSYNAANKMTYYEKQTWSNGSWVNDTKEIWDFDTVGKQTLHEKYNGSNSTWTLALQENSNYDEAGNNTLVENYSLTNTIWKGTKKEEYTYVGTSKTGTITYNWNADNNAFVYKTWSINNTAENPNEKCSYNWVNDAWVGTGTRKLTTKTEGKTTEVITQTWPSGSTVWVNKTCTTTVYVGDNKTQETYYNWSNDAWVGTKRTDYIFNADGINVLTNNAKWQDSAWVMTSMTRTDISDETIDGIRQTSCTRWQCGADLVWKGVQKDTISYYITAENTQNPLYSANFSSWANNGWLPSYKIEYEYDEADREIRNCRMDWVNNKWQGHYLYEYEYDDQGQQTAYTYYGDWNNSTNSWIGGSKYDYMYAANGQYVQKIMYKWLYDANQWVELFRYFYQYDDANHEIEQLVQSYSNGEWQNSQLYIHEYNGTQLIKNNEYRWRNEQWQYSRRNEKIYTDGAQAKILREITGSWNTNGVLSSFTDKHYFYTCDLSYYTIRFVNYDGTELSLESILEGETPSYNGTDPTKPADAQYTYTFAGWDKTIVPATEETVYTAVYTRNINTYTITFYFDDGMTVVEQIVVPYGETPSCRYTPSMMSDEHHYYIFTGWTPEIVPATCDASYTPTYELVARQYTITFRNYNGRVLQSSKIDYGVMPEYTGDTPTRIGSDQYTYVFVGWNPELAPVSGDAVYKAVFENVTNTFLIIFYDEDGVTELDEVEIAYGKVPSTSVVPTKEDDDEYTYTFAGWQPKPVAANQDATYKASYKATPKTEGINVIETGETATKVIIDHQIFIRRGSNTYTLDGQLVK